MKTIAFIILGCAFALSGCSSRPSGYSPKEGDVVFQSLPRNPLVDAIEGATHSRYSHCGLIVWRDGEWRVLEAIGPVQETRLSSWIKQGRGGEFAAYRFEEELSARIPEIISAARRYLGREYDIHYRFDNDEIYCSELILLAFREVVGRDLGKVVRLGDLDWREHTDTILQIEEVVPVDREMITPVGLSRAPELHRIYGDLPERRAF